MENKIAIIGHFGADQQILDGQTIKTRILYQELTSATSWHIQKVDTYYRGRNNAKLVWQSIKALCTAESIIVLLSGNGMRFYFPILYLFAKVFRKKVYHDVIGGNLADYVEKYPMFRKYLNVFRVNWVETESMKRTLEKVGVVNAEVLPNFKRLNIVDEDSLTIQTKEPFSFCTFSRVMKEKGIETAIEAIEEINSQAGRQLCTLDIYGRIDSGYAEHFQTVMTKATSAIQYRGEIPFHQSVEAIKGSYALLFPTYWNGEGFAGTIVDGFSAGLPVIATDWNCNGEIIKNGVNGILYPNAQISSLKDAVEWAINHPKDMEKMRYQAVCTARYYQPDRFVQQIIRKMEQG